MFRNTPILPSHTALCIFFPFYHFQTCGSHPDLRPTTINSKYYHFCNYVALVCTSTNHSSIWPLAWRVFFRVDGVLAGLIQQSSQRGTAFPFISPSTGTEEDLGDLRSPCTLCMTNHCSSVLPDSQVPAPRLSSGDIPADEGWMWQTTFLPSLCPILSPSPKGKPQEGIQ